ncbi:MAG: hypothetical protein H0T46_24345 [Deltaproteobacteria bacterium]|nr:hypothetical protein [Deltaproteobacteria bacterium]
MRRAPVVVLVLASTAAADPRLVLTHEPPPRHLKMRPRTVAQTSPSARTPTPMPAAPPPLARAEPALEQTVALRDLRDRVSFEIGVGYQVESANPSGRSSLGARAPVVGQDYAKLRSYGFADVYGSTRSLGLASLSSYFAVRFQAARRLEYSPAPGQTVAVPPPIATWFERSGVDIRYGWAELRDFLPPRWSLSKVRLRAGGQHVYGPWIIHLDGGLIAYDGKIVTASGYAGYRHSDYTRDQSDQRPAVAGASLRVDLRGLKTPIPLALQAEALSMGASRISASSYQPQSESTMLQGDWRPRRDVAVIGQFRALDRKAASQKLEVRARYKQVTNVVFELTHHTMNDWQWDPAVHIPDADPTAAKRYLDLGPVVPQFIGSARAGTLIAENVDLLIRGAFATEGSKRVTDASGTREIKNSFAAPYLELGGAVEIRLRRTLAMGLSLLSRQTSHPLPEDEFPIFDQKDVPQQLPRTESRGEEGFTELGGSLRMSLGARKFSSLVEFYGRRTRYAPLYTDPTLLIPESDLRFGGRFTLDAWVGDRVRISAAYDVSSALELAPEITGYRSLRLMLTGVY